MNPIKKLTYALSACLFAAIALCSIIVYGNEWSRNTAILASFLAYGSFITFLLSFFWLVRGW